MIGNQPARLNRATLVTLITLGSILMSLAITYFALQLQGEPMRPSIMLIAFMAPLLIAPLVSWRLVSLLLQVHRLEQEMRQLATYDALTGAFNRRAFLNGAEQTLQISQRDRQTAALLYLDIDNFKKINDTYGHAGGDAALKNFTRVLDNLKRDSDLLGRLGGEEFAMMIPNTSREGALHFAEKVLDAVRKTVANHRDIAIRNTVSIGLAMFDPTQKISLDQLAHLADEALYQAKHSGKDRVVVHGDTVPPSPLKHHAMAERT